MVKKLILSCYIPLAIAITPVPLNQQQLYHHLTQKEIIPNKYDCHKKGSSYKIIYCQNNYTVFCEDMCLVLSSSSLGNPYGLGLTKRKLMSPVSVTPNVTSCKPIKNELIYNSEMNLKLKNNTRLKVRRDKIGIDINF